MLNFWQSKQSYIFLLMSISKKSFFKAMSSQGLALTFDDVRLDTAVSDASTQELSICSNFSKNIPLRVPIISSAMDTVTTAEMAIAMAKLGGLGVIHAGLSPEQQKQEVRKVKLELNGLIEKPITVNQNDSLLEILQMCTDRDFDFRSFPVVDDENNFIGLITQNDFDFTKDHKTKAMHVMTPKSKVTTSKAGITPEEAFETMRSCKKKTLPLLDRNNKIQGLYVLSDVLRLVKGNPDKYNLNDNGQLIAAAAVPTDDGALERIELMKNYLDVVVIDSAQGDSKYAFETLKKIKKSYPNIDVVVGNISSANSALRLAKAGADGIKVGQGPGSICTTRVETGIGCPQITAVYECAEAVKEYNVPIIADGGISNPGDISLAIAAGASSVMMGSGLAGSKESPGKVIITDDNKMVKLYRGMGSKSAMQESEASRKRYGADLTSGKPLSEGVESYVPYKGSVLDLMDHYIKALKKSMSYVGSKDIKSHQNNTRFIRITNAGFKESNPHDVAVLPQ